MTFVPLPLKKALSPPYLYIPDSPCITVVFPVVCACNMTFKRSRGAVDVLDIAPAIPPAVRVTSGDIAFVVGLSYGIVILSPISKDSAFYQ